MRKEENKVNIFIVKYLFFGGVDDDLMWIHCEKKKYSLNTLEEKKMQFFNEWHF